MFGIILIYNSKMAIILVLITVTLNIRLYSEDIVDVTYCH